MLWCAEAGKDDWDAAPDGLGPIEGSLGGDEEVLIPRDDGGTVEKDVKRGTLQRRISVGYSIG